MEIILTHEQADFDAAGSVLAAWLLDPSRIPILPKRRNRNLAAFLEDYKSRLPFFTWQTVPKNPITRVYITDTQNISMDRRLIGVRDFIVWDHHPHAHAFPDRDENIYEKTGACTTFLVEKLAEKPDIHPGRIFTTLMLMGIYEDTGFLSYGSVTPRDLRAAAWLLDHGADPDLLRRYVLQPLTEHQMQVADLLLKDFETYTISGQKIMIAAADVREISDEYSSVAHHLRDMLSPDGLLLILGTKSGIRLIGRATTDDIDFGGLMKHYQGGGHSRAASALIPVEDPEIPDLLPLLRDLRQTIRDEMPEYIAPPAVDLSKKLEDHIPPEGLKRIRLAAEAAERMDMPLYLVGGVVRDLMDDRPVNDFDLVCEGNAILLGKRLQSVYGGKLTVHPQFFTAKWELADGGSLDLISARSESYAAPAALPTVEMGSIADDLRRRDFTLNTLAVRLDGAHWGELIDCCGGLADLRHQLIRTLHDRSFIDDPTRIFRAVRFEQRLDFMLEQDTMRQLREQVFGVGNLTGQRIWHELALYCAESFPEDDFARIVRLGIAGQIHSGFTWTDRMEADCAHFRVTAPESYWKETGDPEIAAAEKEGILWVWLSSFPKEMIGELALRLLLPGKTSDAIEKLGLLREAFPANASGKLSECVFFLETIPLASLYCYDRITESSDERALIRRFVEVYRKLAPYSTGRDLIQVGIEPGPRMKEILLKLRAARIDGEIGSREEEKHWLERFGRKDL